MPLPSWDQVSTIPHPISMVFSLNCDLRGNDKTFFEKAINLEPPGEDRPLHRSACRGFLSGGVVPPPEGLSGGIIQATARERLLCTYVFLPIKIIGRTFLTGRPACDGNTGTQIIDVMFVAFHRHTVVCLVFVWLTPLSVAYAQGHFVSGTVRDGSTNELLPFANISVNGFNTGTVTDANGSYKLPLKAGSYDLIISFVG